MPFSQALPRIFRYGQDLMGRIIASDAYAWARPILIEVGVELLERARVLAVGWSTRCVSLISFFFGVSEVLLAQVQGFPTSQRNSVMPSTTPTSIV
jgi:hypothetical protein